MAKELTAAFQDVVLTDQDCGTKLTLDVLVTDWMMKDIGYRYIVEGNKLVLLDPETLKKYRGKRVKMRSPMFCKSKGVCHVCAGQMFDKMGIETIGLTTSAIAGTLTNLNMKQFHDSSVKFNKIDLDNLTL